VIHADRPPPVDIGLVRRVPALAGHLGVAATAAGLVAVAIIAQAEVLARVTATFVGFADASLAGAVPILVAVIVLRGLAAAATEISAARAMQRARATLRADLLDHALVDAAPDVGSIASRRASAATSGLDALESYIRVYLPALVTAVVVPIAAGLWIMGADWLSGVIIAVTVPLIPVFMVLIGVVTESWTQRRWGTLQRLSGHFLDVVEGIPTLRLFGRIPTATAAVREVSERYREVTMGTLRIAFVSALALELVATLSVAVVAVSIGLRLASGSMDLTSGLVVLLLVSECYLPLRRVGAAFHASQLGVDAHRDISDILDRGVLPTGHIAPPRGPIDVAGIAVDLPGRGTTTVPVSCSVEHGSVTALVGPSGSGKTTVLAVVRGRLVPTFGSVTVGGIDLAAIDPELWADRITVISQRPVRSDETVTQTVAGAWPVTDGTWDAMDEMGIRPLADRPLAEVSGGELRRLEVARTIVAVRAGRADIVIADEPTAHLDAGNARRVAEALVGLAQESGAAVLVATHDRTVADIADVVVNLEVDAVTHRAARIGSSSPSAQVSRTAFPAATATLVPPWAGSAGWGPVRTILRSTGPVRARFAAAAGLGVLAETCTVGLAGVAAWLVLRAAEQPALADLSLAVTAVRAFGIGKGVFRYAERLATHDAAFRVISGIRSDLVAHIGRIAPAGIPGWSRGDIGQRVVDDVDRLVDLFARLFVPAVAIVVTTLGSVVVAFVIDPGAGVAIGAVAVAVGVVAPAVAATLEIRSANTLAVARSEVAGLVLDYCERVDDLIGRRLQHRRRDEINGAAARVDAIERRISQRRAMWAALAAAAPTAAAALLLGIVGPPPGDTIDPAVAMLVLWSLTLIQVAAQLIEPATALPAVATSAARIVGLLNLDVPPDPGAPTAIAVAVPSVTLAGASARWTDEVDEAFSGVDLHLPSGSVGAINGPSGSGKSTVAAVLVAFLGLERGTYALEHVDVEHILGDAVRSRVTWIEQTPWIADSTVRQNLLIADPDAHDDELLGVLDRVGMGDWVRRTTQGLDTAVGRGGAALSGGEAQRLSLGRALLAGHGVVILDEPTAHLDHATAGVVLDNMMGALSGRTVVLLSHDPVDAVQTHVTADLGGAQATV
jgi:ATP-binding cassette, subfamily C, bacterial CydCD